MKLKTHVCLISDQAVPNLVPALDPAIRPVRVIQVISPGMASQAAWLERVLRGHGVRVQYWQITDPWDIEHVQTRIMELLEQEHKEMAEGQIALNVTGGTKPMSIAAYEAMRVYELPIFYVHPEKDRLIWLHPAHQPALDLADRLKIEPFLLAHGAEIKNQPGRNVPDARLLHVGEQIVLQLERYAKPLATLNWLAASATHTRVSAPLKKEYGDLKALIDLFQENGFLKRQEGCLYFSSEPHRFFVNGGWLEYLVFDGVRQLRTQDTHIHDIARSVHVTREQSGKDVPNELDVALLRNNCLHIIECKTRQFRGKGEDSPGAEALYKLDTLADLMGGLKARAMLVSYQKIPRHNRIRAADLGIAICSGTQLRSLKQHLQAFIST